MAKARASSSCPTATATTFFLLHSAALRPREPRTAVTKGATPADRDGAVRERDVGGKPGVGSGALQRVFPRRQPCTHATRGRACAPLRRLQQGSCPS